MSCDIALRLLRADAPEAIMCAPEVWPRWAVLLPHVLAAVEHLETGDGGSGAGVWWLLDRAGVYLQVHGHAGEARNLLERALAIAEGTYGTDHPSVARCLSTLAMILKDLGEFGAARALQERALGIDEAVYEPDHPRVANDMNDLALVLCELGEFSAARSLLERALAIDEAVYLCNDARRASGERA